MKKKYTRCLSIVLSLLLSIFMFVSPSFNIKSEAAIVGIEKAIEWALGIARDESHGYDQKNRWGPSDYDCSSLVITAFKNAGFVLNGATYTGNMKSVFVNEGFVWISKSDLGGLNDETDTQYLKRGDILLNEAKHTELYLGGNNAVGAHCNEFGDATGGKPGDQTGSEICERYTSNEYFSNHRYDGVLRLDTKTYNVETPCNIYLEVSKSDGSVHRTEPRKAAPTVGERISHGTIVHAIAKKANEYSHLWYKLDDNSWIYSGNVKQPTKYTIKYDANGGSGAPATQKKIKGEAITLSTGKPTRRFFRFIGWEDTVNKKTIQPGASYSADKSTTMKAKWKLSNTYVTLSKYSSDICLNDSTKDTVTLKITNFLPANSRVSTSVTNNDVATCSASNLSGKEVNDQNLFDKSTITIKAKKPGTTICNIIVESTSSGPNFERTVYNRSSIYITVTRKSTITYNANGGSGAPATQTKVSNKSLTLSDKIPTRKNFTFMGWTSVKGGTTPEYGPGDLITNQISNDVTLYAIWSENYHIDHSWDANSKTLTITGYGDMAFYSQSSPAPWAQYKNTAEKIVIGEGVTSVGSFAFYGFNKVTTVDTPFTLKVIYNHAFSNCGSLRNISIPTACEPKEHAFSYCKKLESVSKKSKKSTSSYSKTSDETVEIGAFAFEGCESLTSFDLSNAEYIGEGAFSGCSSLNNVIIPEGIDNIEDTVFFNCESLTNISIPESVTTISDGAFQGCTSIESIDIPENVTEIGSQVFSGCTSVESITVPENVEIIGASAFSNCTALTDVSLPDNMTYLGNGMFSGCSSLTEIDIPNSISSLGDGTFLGCSSLSSIDLPDNIYTIGNSVFSGCTSLNDVSLGDSLNSIESYAFYGCTGIENIDIPGSVNELGSCTFARCTSLKSASIPSSVTTINTSAFMGCTSLETVTIEDGAELNIGSEAFAECTSLKNIQIPESAVSVSQTAFARCSGDMSVSCFSTSAAFGDIESTGVNCNALYHPTNLQLNKTSADLKKGETLKLNAIFTPANTTNKNITWESDGEDVATVSEDGTVTAVGSGIATITAISEDGNIEASCEVNCIIPVDSIEIITNVSDLFIGTEVDLLWLSNPEQPTNIDVTWNSSNPSAVTVDAEGTINVVGAGSSTITVTTVDGNKTDSIVITGKQYIPVDEIKLTESTINIGIGGTAAAKYSVLPSNATDKTIYFYSENEDIATVNDEGIITGVSKGTTKIYLNKSSYGEESVYITVNVTKPTEKAVVHSVSVNDASVNYKGSITLNPSIVADEGASYTKTFTSSNPSVATVDNNGKVTSVKQSGLNRGSTVITCTVTDSYGNTVTDTCKVTVQFTAIQWIIKIVLFGWLWY